MQKDYEGQSVVVTAAGSGMGYEIALQLVEAGASVTGADIDTVALDRLAEAAKGKAGTFQPHRCDIADAGEVAALAEAVLARGPVDYMFNHAGISAAGRFEDIPIPVWERLSQVNIIGTAQMVQAFLPAMRVRGKGHIVNTASTLALFLDSAFHAPYLATKAGIIAMSRSLALQLEGSGVRVSVFCPDLTETGFYRFSTLHGLTPEEFRARAAPAERQDPAEVARELLARLPGGPFVISMAPQTGPRWHDAVDAMLGEAG